MLFRSLHSQGVPELSRERREALRAAKPAFDRAWDAWDADRESTEVKLDGEDFLIMREDDVLGVVEG